MARKKMLMVGLIVLLMALAFPATPALAHHDWSAYDTSETVYLSGFIGDVSWQNPHPDIQLEVPPGLGVPENLAATDISEELEKIGGRQSLERATVPEDAGGTWTVDLESPSFMEGVGMNAPPSVGEPLQVIGFLNRQEPRTLRVESVVLADGQTLSVRNSAVATLPTGVTPARDVASDASGADTPEANAGSDDESDIVSDRSQSESMPTEQVAGAEDDAGSGSTAASQSPSATWTERIEANPFSELLRSSRWGYPIAEIAHLLGLAALVGAAALFDLRLLGFWRRLSVTDAARHLMRVVWIGFVLTVATGALMFVTDATELVSNPAFRLKMSLIFVAGCNAAAFHIGTFGSVEKWDADKATPAGAKFAAVVSLLVWAGVVACGRLIAYV